MVPVSKFEIQNGRQKVCLALFLDQMLLHKRENLHIRVFKAAKQKYDKFKRIFLQLPVKTEKFLQSHSEETGTWMKWADGGFCYSSLFFMFFLYWNTFKTHIQFFPGSKLSFSSWRTPLPQWRSHIHKHFTTKWSPQWQWQEVWLLPCSFLFRLIPILFWSDRKFFLNNVFPDPLLTKMAKTGTFWVNFEHSQN